MTLTKLGGVCNFVRGPFGGALKKDCFVQSGFAVYEQQHAIYRQFSTIRYYIDKEKFEELKRFELRAGDLIMSCSGTMGKVAKVPKGIEKGIINQALLKLTPSENINLDFLTYWMESKSFQDQLSGNTHGAAIKNIASVKILKDLEIPLPPLPEQQKIAAILDAADKLKQKDQQLIEKYNTLSQSLFLDMFGDPKLNPKKWKLSYLHEVIEDGPQNGLYKPSKDYGSGAPIIRIDSFHNSIVETKSLKRVNINETELSNFEIFENDFVINRVNSPSHLGKCGLVPKINERMVYESNMMRVKFNTKKTNIVFMLSILSSQYLKNQILNSSKDAVNQSSINQKDVNNFTIPLPPINLQNQFAERIQAIESQKQQAQASLQKSEDLFNSLLQRAFKGELTA